MFCISLTYKVIKMEVRISLLVPLDPLSVKLMLLYVGRVGVSPIVSSSQLPFYYSAENLLFNPGLTLYFQISFFLPFISLFLFLADIVKFSIVLIDLFIYFLFFGSFHIWFLFTNLCFLIVYLILEGFGLSCWIYFKTVAFSLHVTARF